MTEFARVVKYSNESAGTSSQPYPPTNTDPAAGSEYNAATISGIVFGIFMALLALYSIWQYSRQYTMFIGHLLRQHGNGTNSLQNIDLEGGTLNSTSSDRELQFVERQDTDETQNKDGGN